jgi:hypothetical protein
MIAVRDPPRDAAALTHHGDPMKKNALPKTASVTPTAIDLAHAKVAGASGSNTVFVPRRNGETGIL